MSIFIWYAQSQLQKFIIAFFFLELIKNMLVNSLMTQASIIKKLSIDLPRKSMDLFLYDRYHRHKRVNEKHNKPKANNGLILWIW